MTAACGARHAAAQAQAKTASAAPNAAASIPAASSTAKPRAPSAVEEARARFEQGQNAYRGGQLKLALQQFLRAYELAPSTELEFDLARVYERLGDAAAAIKHFRNYLRAVELSESEQHAIEARIEKQESLLARQRAVLIEAPPSSAALTAEARDFFERGKKLFRQNHYAAALEAFAAARRFAALPELTYNLAVTCERLDRRREAVDYYREYLRDAPDAPDAEVVRARTKALSTDRSPAP